VKDCQFSGKENLEYVVIATVGETKKKKKKKKKRQGVCAPTNGHKKKARGDI